MFALFDTPTKRSLPRAFICYALSIVIFGLGFVMLLLPEDHYGSKPRVDYVFVVIMVAALISSRLIDQGNAWRHPHGTKKSRRTHEY